ncbi:Ca2+-transporting ATPase [Parabacteroides sp. PF5-5]|uniref:calcium-translocating P-type ATPase, PMCA-type n=1 Tax=unclassified Parabacteroides TaxID=2649774 RepID=UPI002474ADDF|nr:MULTISPECIES: calcium-translocating P-type ATPase, PMCA-type [unclassified Parabacteroides]MDH6303608.1 Ca2+-transporting ATPase [Parabacteroides sp. PH5-39]MDH6314930.1 Ca2+-transporting ATPase [Parabacteroides sp. PF5-13]MDH6318267.1 Ca2+-transporting ATPase [Parabacteroides sp. PH5-13]MDH6321800.1 Ca2+-transporting ATPase [Parabacteroides sp. PH5-8]MDH6325924.1 Ca2+-transporting ATPase [Parabacteroides sp. PH5-41]
MEVNMYNVPVEIAAGQVHADIRQGLSSEEAKKRLNQDGFNEFRKQKRKTLLVKFFEQFKSFMILVLLIAAAISGVVGYMNGEGFTDAIIILVIVILNACIGTAQELKAEKSLEALEKLSAPYSKVIRNGQVETIPSREIVKGDLVVIETGDLVPADMRLVEAVNLKIEEAALTGESVPETKHTEPIEGEVPLGDRENMAYSSTLVSYGRGKGLVVATAMDTEVGKIAGMIQSVPDMKTPMQVKIDQLGKFLGIAALAICALIFLVGILEGREVLAMFMTAVSLAAAAIPEGLPAVSTIVLAIGVQRLAKKNAIVRHLPSVETLGSTNVICSDKTGTLTQNRMTIVSLFTDNRAEEVAESLSPDQQQLLVSSILANDAKLSREESKWQTTGDPTETAFLDLGIRFNLNKNSLEKETPRVAEIPFDSERKMMTTVNKQDNLLTVHTKGGLDELLACCSSILSNGIVKPLSESEKDNIRKANVKMAGKALRVLGVGRKSIDSLPAEISPQTLENGLTFIGMVGMIDPPREEVKDAVMKCRTAGIKPVMITGDHKITATAIAESLEIIEDSNARDTAMTGSELDKLSDEELLAIVDQTSVYARVSPEHKVRIIKAFQRKGEIVAMTGDGVNDAPALKLADIGLAMGITGTDVSKEAADVVLADDNFTTIVAAVEEGRRIYDNILKAIQFMLSTNIGEILVIFIAIMANWASPLLPIQILWINLVTDSLPALALSVDPADPDVMQRKPVDARQGFITRPFFARILLQGIMIAGLSLTAFLIGMQTSVETAQTMTFAVLAFTQITHVLNVRSELHSAFRNMFSNKLLLGALAIVLLLMIVVLEVPHLHDIFHLTTLDRAHWLWVIGLSIAPLPILEIVKGVIRLTRGKAAQK